MAIGIPKAINAGIKAFTRNTIRSPAVSVFYYDVFNAVTEDYIDKLVS